MNDAGAQQGVWLFTRDGETVRVAVQPGPAGFHLAIFGPGSASASFDFAEQENLERFRESYERDLLARGFRLDAVTERRSVSADREAQGAAERRRFLEP